jgi:hypothetical protein
MLLNPNADFALARELRADAGVPLGEAFAFMSGLYFRGKLAYARAFARSRDGSGVHVITPGLGLVSPDQRVRREDLMAMAEISVALEELRYREPLERDAARLGGSLEGEDAAILLGSIATDKYVGVLEDRLGPRLRFPSAFVGRGDMSRGGLMLRCVSEGRELDYAPIAGATRNGPRPPRLEPLPRASRVAQGDRAR